MSIEFGKTGKAAFVVYPSVMDTLRALPSDQVDKAVRAIVDYGITGKSNLIDESLKIALLPIMTGIDTQKRRYRNIRVMNMTIDNVYRRVAGAVDKCGLLKAEKIISSLKKIVVECQKQDLYLFQIVMWVEQLVRNPDISRLIDYAYSQGNGSYESFLGSNFWQRIVKQATDELHMLTGNGKRSENELQPVALDSAENVPHESTVSNSDKKN